MSRYMTEKGEENVFLTETDGKGLDALFFLCHEESSI